MKCKYNIKELIESLDFTKDYVNNYAMKETLNFIVDTLTTQVKISQNEMDYEERLSHNWNDYEVAKAVRNFCQSFLNDLGVE
jgi:hypothetical protein